MDMKIYNCRNPEENPLPRWMQSRIRKKEPEEVDLVTQFKNNPDSFFPDFLKKKQ